MVEESGHIRTSSIWIKRGSIDNTANHHKGHFPGEWAWFRTMRQEGRCIIGLNSLLYRTYRCAHSGILYGWIMGEQDISIQGSATLWIKSLIGIAPFSLPFTGASSRNIRIDGDDIFPGNNIQSHSVANIFNSVLYDHLRSWSRGTNEVKVQRTHYAMFDFYPWPVGKYQSVMGSNCGTVGRVSGFCVGYPLQTGIDRVKDTRQSNNERDKSGDRIRVLRVSYPSENDSPNFQWVWLCLGVSGVVIFVHGLALIMVVVIATNKAESCERISDMRAVYSASQKCGKAVPA